MDGELEGMIGHKMWGLPPDSWTDFHFMMYRSSNDDHLGNFYASATVLKNVMGVENTVPIVEITGYGRFLDGYFNGSYNSFEARKQTL